MGLFENKHFTVGSISILVILNLVLIGLLIAPKFGKRDSDRKDRDQGDRRSAYIAKKLSFTDSQIETYDSLNTNHRQETIALQQKIDQKRREMFKLTRNKDASLGKADSLTTEIGALVSNMEFRTYEHISNIRALCTPDQLQELDSLLQRMIKNRRNDGREAKDPPPPR